MKTRRRQLQKPLRIRHPLDIAMGMRVRDVRMMQQPRITQEWLAREMDTTTQQIQKYESGENRISFSKLCEIARAMDITLYELIGPACHRKLDHPDGATYLFSI